MLFGVLSKKYRLIQGFKDLHLFFSKKLYFYLIFRSLIQFEFILYKV